MTGKIFFDKIEDGFEIPALRKRATTRQIVEWACFRDQLKNKIHYDKEFAQSQGFPEVPVQGDLVCSFLSQMLTDWLDGQGTVKKLSCSFRGVNFPSHDILCKGRVSAKYSRDGENCLACEIWAENDKGEKTVPGEAVVVLTE